MENECDFEIPLEWVIESNFNDPNDYWDNQTKFDWLLQLANNNHYRFSAHRVLQIIMLLDIKKEIITPKTIAAGHASIFGMWHHPAIKTIQRYLATFVKDGVITRYKHKTGGAYHFNLFKSVTN